MSEQENKTEGLDVKEMERKVHDLAEAMERVKDKQASRDDVVIDMKQAERTRLELLAKDLQSVFDAVPHENDQFEFALSHGEPPRLWIDITAHVRMAGDRRIFEFVKDTRLGRTILYRTENKERMGEVVSDYVAERILERQRAIEGEWLSLKGYDFDQRDGDGGASAKDADDHQSDTPAGTNNKKAGDAAEGGGWFKILLFFFGGMVLGAAALIAWAWFGNLPGGTAPSDSAPAPSNYVMPHRSL